MDRLPQGPEHRKHGGQSLKRRCFLPLLQESLPHNRFNLHVGAPAVGRSQDPNRCQPILRIRQHPQHVDAINHLLSLKKVSFALGEATKIMTPKGVDVGSHVGQRAKQHRNMARLNGHPLTVQKQQIFINDFIPQPLRQRFSLRTAGLIRLPRILPFPIRVFLRRSDESELHPFMGKGLGLLRRGGERFVVRLHSFDGNKQLGTTAVHRFEHLRVGAEIAA